MLRKRFGRRIRELRTQKNITQEKFAEVVGVSLSTVKRWEKAQDAPEFDRIEHIAKALGIEVGELFKGL